MSSPQSSTIQDPEETKQVNESNELQIKVEMELENPEDYENCHFEVKQECNIENAIISQSDYSTHMVKIENNVDIHSEINENLPDISDNSLIQPKAEVDYEEYPHFDDMDSSEATALGQVEACLQDELDIKTEDNAEDHKDFIDIKEELNPPITETHLISKKLISTTSTVTNPQYGFIESQTTNTLVMEILPISQTGNESLTIMRHDPEEILSTPFCMKPDTTHEEFQLNSITGDILSLEQQAYAMNKPAGEYPCHLCNKVLKSKHSLGSHLKLHSRVDKRALGVLKSIKTRQINKEKELETSIEERMFKKKINKDTIRKECKYVKMKKIKSEPIEIESKEIKTLMGPVKSGSYVCTCGKVFQRKSRLETCLRSHNECSKASCYSCITCSKQFGATNDLVKHRKKQHHKRFHCKFCPTDHNTQKELFRHLQIHQKVQLTEFKVMSEVITSKQKLQCFMCTKSFEELSDLKLHSTDHTEPFSCRFCKNTFPDLREFATHIKSFHPKVEAAILDVLEAFSQLAKAWKCEDCGEQFYEADKFALHQVSHETNSKMNAHYQCPDCRRIFLSNKGLTSHRRIHETEATEEKELLPPGIMCLECRKMCNDINHLTFHMRLHSMDRKYPCKYCDFRFATPEKRKTHAEIHTGDMKFVCFICEYQCSSENRLKQHKTSIKHLNMQEFLLTGKPLVEEPPQSKIQNTSKKKRKHEKRKSDDASLSSVSCDICGEKFDREDVMLEHKQTHPFIEFPHEETPTRIFFK